MKCYSFCLANQFDLSALLRYLKTQRHLLTTNFGGVIHCHWQEENQQVFIFEHGMVVTWNFQRRALKQLLAELTPYMVQPLPHIEKDSFSYRFGPITSLKPHPYFNVDIITLEEDSLELYLALSYALAQSVKLEMYERQISQMINEYSWLPNRLAEYGHCRLSRKRISKIMGRIFVTKSQVNLKSEFLITPKFFWRIPAAEKDYLKAQRYLDLPQRAEALNQKLDILSDTIDLLKQENEHSSFKTLEIIIIALIAVEVVFSVLTLWHL